ncbi:biotin-dependent carboxyltransferase family protein [Saccharopolyspora sp. K220]|uniref:5-oxoprolinase subunit C family protein n=1 Tax=Saccharopolyspora soli TaxID=2926618 RepID=UPI001F59FF26|nr:biotin-dependent carboxyltransferase family protein [Saccharopolyspora soli]MCI2422651.1 biotin-dependent carboxyltransferase family protein [Saccharopolyspora soli]
MSIEIIEAAEQIGVQDHPGRIGLQAHGLFPAGPLDNLAFRLANALVGNDPSAAGLEIPMGRFTIRVHFAGLVALCGADGAEPTINDRPLPMWESVALEPGDVLACGAVKGPGFRLYLAVSGGIDVPPVLGSRALHTLGGIGGLDGRALIRGDLLPVASSAGPPRRRRVPQALRPGYHRDWEIEVVRGPHADPEFLTAADWREFTTARWRVNVNAGRLGVPLNPHRFQWARAGAGPAGDHPSNVLDASYPLGGIIVNGDVPTILGPDGPTSGGFTVIATVVHAALWKLGQLRPGADTLRFREVGLDEADALARHVEFPLTHLEILP